MKRPTRFWFFPLVALFSSQALGIEAFTIKSIEVEGLQRITQGTLFNYLPLQTGDRLDDVKSRQALAALYKTGFFNNIDLYRDGDALLIKVEERPSIAAIIFEGNHELSTDDLKTGLKSAGLSEGKILDRSLLDKIKLDLQRQYFVRGHYAVEIETAVTPLEDNRANLNITVREGEVATIKQINLVGNTRFDDETLLDRFELGIPPFYAIFSDSDQYSKQKLAADTETLRSWYLDRGHINFAIDSAQVSITPDRNSVYITINMHEGEEFKVSEVGLAGDLVVGEEELRKLITLQPGETFSRRVVTDITTAITDRLGEEGYAFANVNAVPEIDEEGKRVALTFFIDPGKRVYVRNINISGNQKTEDEVLRREFRQMEGGWLSTSKLNRSRVRVQRLSYVEQVTIETPPVPGVDDEVDVNLSLNERPSGSLMVGVGYSGGDGMLFNASVSQENFLGTGKRVSTEINSSKVNTVYSFSHTDPYFTLDGVSQSMRLYYRETDAAQANLANYISNVWGGSLSYGIPLSEYSTARIGLGYESTEIKTTDQTPQSYLDYLAANSDKFGITKLTLGWTHDTRNKTVFASDGLMQSLSAEVTTPNSGLNFYKVSSNTKWLTPLTKKLTASLEGDIAYGNSFNDTTDVPFFEKYYAGGAHSVRGYRANTLGPKDNKVNLGGNFRVTATGEIVFPPPFAEDSSAVRMSLFWDVGNVFADTGSFETAQLRQSAGVSLIWLSPVGPLSFSLAEPLNDKPGDRIERFQFTLGSFF